MSNKCEFCPPAFTRGKERMPYIASVKQMKNCVYANENSETCPRLNWDGRNHRISCGTCPFHPESFCNKKQ